MAELKIFLCIVVIFLQAGVTYGWWPFSTSNIKDEKPTAQKEDSSETPPAPARFEVTTAESKFLADAQQLLNMSPLDQCQAKVVSRLRSSCSEMSDETLGKFAVHLLNCQSQAENRKLYPCTDLMDLSECTSSMDATTWNAYHIISNRARSVCYSIQQQNFRRQTEAAVNKLSESTLQQLLAVQELESSHKQIKDFTEESVKSFHQHQELLSKQQEDVINTQIALNDHIGQNIDQLNEEKTMILSGQILLTSMTEEIRNQLEEASILLEKQEGKREESHKKIVDDIDNIKYNIDQVWKRVDNSSLQLLTLMDRMSLQYEDTLDNLQLINSSVSSMVDVVTTMNSALTRNLEWMVNWLGGAQDGLHVLTTLAIHGVFLLLATLCLLFVKAPALTRIALLVMVATNALAEVKLHVSLTLTAMTILQALLLVGNWLYIVWIKKYKLNQPSTTYMYHHHHNRHNHPAHNALPSNENMKRSNSPPPVNHNSVKREPREPDLSSVKPETLTFSPTKFIPSSPTPSCHSTPVKSASLMKCRAHTKTGHQCKLVARPGGFTCGRHSSYGH